MAENKNHTPGRTASDDTLNDILSEIKKEPAQPGPLEQTRSFGNEVPVDDNFEQFFKKTVAVIPGQEPEAEFGVKHLPSDFKKHNGYLRSLQLSEEYGLYRQDYCGCEFSAKARGIEKY